MPELPEVQTIVSQLQKALVGKTIERLKWFDFGKMLQPTPRAVASAVRGVKITRVSRRAKLILLHLSSGQIIALHLKLTGRLFFRAKSAPPERFAHVIFTLKGGHELRFADVRKFGYVRVISNEQSLIAIHDEYGPEPLTKDFTLRIFTKILRGRTTKIKPLLLDQARISGLGNIYSDEALFLADLDPRRPAKSLKAPEIKKLYLAILKVLREGIRHHGTSDQWFVDLYGRDGTHQNYLRVYGRCDEPCQKCHSLIKRIMLAGRSSHFCPQCQK